MKGAALATILVAACSNASGASLEGRPPESLDAGAHALVDAGGDDHPGSPSTADAGSGPMAETGAPASTSDAATPSTGCTGASLCDGFESDAPAAAPSGWTVVMGCNPNTTNGPADGGGLVVGIDDAEHHGGSHSLRVVGGDSCGFYAVQSTALAALGPQVYVRLWAMFSAGPTPNHNGFLSMATTGGDHYRLGFQDSVVAWNAQQSDATLPDMDPQGTSTSLAPAARTWTCLEFHLDETSGHLEVWSNAGAEPIAGLSWSGSSVQGVDDQWARGGPSPAVVTTFGLGWLGLDDQQTVWFDDVAFGSARIGCE